MKQPEQNILKLMNHYARILNKLHALGVTRTYNSPVGDYAEWLVSKKMNLTLQPNSSAGFDAQNEATHLRYQIKSRWERQTSSARSRKLNVIRNYKNKQFDFLIVIIFGDVFNVKEAYCIAHKILPKYGQYNKHQNGYVLTVNRNWLTDPNIKNITHLFN